MNDSERKLQRPLPLTTVDTTISAPTAAQIPSKEKADTLGIYREKMIPSLENISATGTIATAMALAPRATDRALRVPVYQSPSLTTLLSEVATDSGARESDFGSGGEGGGGGVQGMMLYSIANSVRASRDLQQSFFTTYARKSLTLTSQLVLVSKAQLEMLHRVGTTLEEKLEAIKLNTSAADARKLTISDRLRETVIANVTGAVGNWVGDKITEKGRDLIFKKIVPSVQRGISNNWKPGQSFGSNVGNLLVAGGTEAILQARNVRSIVSGRTAAVGRGLRSTFSKSAMVVVDDSGEPSIYVNGEMADDIDLKKQTLSDITAIWKTGTVKVERGVSTAVTGNSVAVRLKTSDGKDVTYYRSLYRKSDAVDVAQSIASEARGADIQIPSGKLDAVADILHHYDQEQRTSAKELIKNVDPKDVIDRTRRMANSARNAVESIADRIRENVNTQTNGTGQPPPPISDTDSETNLRVPEVKKSRLTGMLDRLVNLRQVKEEDGRSRPKQRTLEDPLAEGGGFSPGNRRRGAIQDAVRDVLSAILPDKKTVEGTPAVDADAVVSPKEPRSRAERLRDSIAEKASALSERVSKTDTVKGIKARANKTIDDSGIRGRVEDMIMEYQTAPDGIFGAVRNTVETAGSAVRGIKDIKGTMQRISDEYQTSPNRAVTMFRNTFGVAAKRLKTREIRNIIEDYIMEYQTAPDGFFGRARNLAEGATQLDGEKIRKALSLSGVGEKIGKLRSDAGDPDTRIGRFKKRADDLHTKARSTYDDIAEQSKDETTVAGKLRKKGRVVEDYVKKTDTKTLALHGITAAQFAGLLPFIPLYGMPGFGPTQQPQQQQAGVGAGETNVNIAETVFKPLIDEIAEFRKGVGDQFRASSERDETRNALLQALLDRGGTGGDGGPVTLATVAKNTATAVKGRVRTLLDNSLVWNATKGAASLGGKAIKGAWAYNKFVATKAWGLTSAVFRRRDMASYVDVYRRDELDKGTPLVTSNQFKKGLIFERTRKLVTNVKDIVEPVIDPETGMQVITEDDIRAGLVDRTGRPVTKRTKMSLVEGVFGLGARTISGLTKVGTSIAPPIAKAMGTFYTKFFTTSATMIGGIGKFLGNATLGLLSGKAVGGIARGAASIAGGLAGMYKTLFQVGGKVALGTLSLLGKGISNLFGFGNRGGAAASRKDLDQVVGSRLDDIYDLLKAYFARCGCGKDKVAGDADGDGDRDGSYNDQLEKIKKRREEREANAANKPGGLLSRAAGKLGLSGIAAALATNKGTKPGEGDGENKEGGGPGLLETIAGTAVGGWAAGKLGVAKRIAGSALRKTGKGIAAAGKGTWAGTKMAGGLVGAGAGMLGRGVLSGGGAIARGGGKLLAQMGGKALGKSVLKKIPVLGLVAGGAFALNRFMDGDLVGGIGELASGLVSLVPVVGTGMSLAIDAWLFGRDLSNSPDNPVALLRRERMRAYGIDDPSLFDLTESLEEKHDSILTSWWRGRLDDDDFANMAEKYGFNPDDKKQVQFFKSWYRERFEPIFTVYRTLLKQLGKTYEDSDELTDEEVASLHRAFSTETNTRAKKYEKLKPDIKAYNELIGSKEKKEPMTRAGNTLPPKKENDEPYDPTKGSREGAAGKVAVASAVATGGIPKAANTNLAQFQAQYNPAANSTPLPPFPTGRQSLPDENPLTGKFPTGGQSFPADPNDISSLSAAEESGKAGSAAVGYDSTGGTSYGKYQLSSRKGTFGRFLAFLASTGSAGESIARRIMSAGQPDTGSSDGPVPQVWKAVAKESPSLPSYEKEFIKRTHFDVGLQLVAPEVRDAIMRSKTLQAVFWSTAVQHGPGGAAKIFQANYYEGQKPETYVKKIYEHRATQFGSSTPRVRESVWNRFAREKRTALGMLQQDPANDTSQQTGPSPDLPAVSPNSTTQWLPEKDGKPPTPTGTENQRSTSPIFSNPAQTNKSTETGNQEPEVPPIMQGVVKANAAQANAATPTVPAVAKISPKTAPETPRASEEEIAEQEATIKQIKGVVAERRAAERNKSDNNDAAVVAKSIQELKDTLAVLAKIQEEQSKDKSTGDSELTNKILMEVRDAIKSGAGMGQVKTLLEKNLEKPNQVITPVTIAGAPPQKGTPGTDDGMSLKRAG